MVGFKLGERRTPAMTENDDISPTLTESSPAVEGIAEGSEVRKSEHRDQFPLGSF